MKEKIIKLFTELISYDTQSNPNSNSYPSTENQIYFAEMLANKLAMMELENVKVDKNCYVTATLNSNVNYETPIIGLIAHMDTSPEFCGKNIKANIINNYDGNEIFLKNNIVISPNEFDFLKNYIGDTIITSDGTTLLGADDKAGITEILTAIEYLINNNDIKHGEIKIAFTPDEEIGAGVDYFDCNSFKCDFAYTIDGGELGELNYENFNASNVKIEIKGKSVHPGSAKGIMINAGRIASEIVASIPENETPEVTEKYEGFYHLIKMKCTIEKSELEFIIRDFDKENLQKRKYFLTDIVKNINKKYKNEIAKINIKDEYENMFSVISKNKHIIERAEKAIKEAGITPKIVPIRGGTDGARLSFMGIPCPNLFTGGHNFHGCYELISVNSMEKAVQTIINLVRQ